MSYPPQQRMLDGNAGPSSQQRVNGMLDAIKHEFDVLSNEASSYRLHKDEYDHKLVTQQSNEIQQIRQSVYELELVHRKMKDTYEEEIMRLKRELEARGGGTPKSIPSIARNATSVANAAAGGLPAPPTGTVSPSGGASLGHPYGGIQDPQAAAAAAAAAAAQQQAQIQQQQQHQHAAQQAQAQAQQQAGQQQAQHAQQHGQPPQTQGHSGATAPSQYYGGYNGAKTEDEAATKNGSSIAAAPSAANTSALSSEELAIQLGNNLGDVDLDKVSPEFKKQRDDWFVLYNERAPRRIDVDLVHSLDHNSVVCCVRFSLDGKYVATGSNRCAQIFDVQTGKLVCKLQDDTDGDFDLYIRSVCFSPDGRFLATGAEDKQIRVWDIKTQSIRYLFSGHEQDIYSLDFSKNGKHIASGSGDRTVRMWDMESGQCVLTLSIEDGVTTVAISPDGRYVAAGSLDKTVRVWDTSTGFLVERLEAPDGHKDSVYSVNFTPNGKDLVSASLDKTLKLWELQAPRGAQSTHKGGVCVRTFIGHKDFVLSVALTPDSQWILSGSKDRGIQFWDPQTAQAQLLLQGHKNSVISVAPSPTGELFATGSGDCRARIWRYYPTSSS